MKSISTTGMARYNRDLILGLLRTKGVLSRKNLREEIGASPATINRLTAQLVSRKVLKEVGRAPSTGGRPSTLLEFNGNCGSVISIDIGSSVLRAAIINLTGEVLVAVEESVTAQTARERLVQVQSLIRQMLVKEQNKRRLLGVGVGVPGVVDTDGKVTWAPALAWHNVPLRQAIESVVDVPVVIENDANALAIAEQRAGEYAGASCLVAINLGNGVGAGLMIDGTPYRGHAGMAGEIGYMLAGPDALAHTFAGFGDLENRVGVAGIVERAAAKGLSGTHRSVMEVFQRAREGEQGFLDIVDEVAKDLTLAVANLAVVLNPEVIIFGGGVAGSADLLIPRIEASLSGRIPYSPKVSATSLGTEGVLRGVAEVAISNLETLDGVLG